MADNLATWNGAIQMAYSGSTPWHGLGQKISPTADVAEAMKAAQIDQIIAHTEPVYLRAADGSLGAKVDDCQAVLDSRGHVFGSVGADYTVAQYSDTFGILSDVCRDFGVTINAAGVLGNGERAWMLARLPDADVTVTDGDDVRGYFCVASSHDGTLAHRGKITPIRVVCQNTLTAAAMERDSQFTIKHTKNAAQRRDAAVKLIHAMHAAMKATGQTYRQMADRKLSQAELRSYIESVLPAPTPAAGAPAVSDGLKSKREQLARLFYGGKGAEFAPETLWNAYNAVTEYVDHVKPAEAASKAGRDRANTAAIFGSGDLLKLAAMRSARQLLAV